MEQMKSNYHIPEQPKQEWICAPLALQVGFDCSDNSLREFRKRAH